MPSDRRRRRSGSSRPGEAPPAYSVYDRIQDLYAGGTEEPTVRNSPQATANASPVQSPPQSSEQTPLLARTQSQQNYRRPWNRRSNCTVIMSLLFFVLAPCIIILIIKATTVEEALDPVARDRIRREWDKEIRSHQAIRQEWIIELANHEKTRVGWESERQELIAMREQLVRDKEEWMREREEERGAEERRRREEEDRVRAKFSWENLQGAQNCLQYGTRRYTARLANVPREYDPVKACTETAVEIHGVKISSPHQCEDRGCAGVIGYWNVNYSEPACITHFDNFNDKGCTAEGSGRRRIDSRLENLHGGDYWSDMCSTTPASFRNMHFAGPDMCEDWGIWGVWGMWNINDPDC
ncbi:hypothetical protein R3P38DRAFT_2879102 [Favolaschia claudopus]|uniref:Uncharacterized protein n=1 Tax=Favolaschia claudopus TaxID=2862362 RepID=A0AAW0D099_9AGAR